MPLHCYVDIETTGLNPGTDRITRISGVKAKGYEVVDLYDQLICPGLRVPMNILHMTGLNQEILDLSPTLKEITPKFQAFAKGCTLIAWGNFENKWLPHNGLAPKCFDACAKTRRKLAGRGIANFKLDTVSRYFSIPLHHHNALSDALAIYHIVNLLGLTF